MNSKYILSRILGTTRNFLLFIALILLFLGFGIAGAWFLAARVTDRPSVIPAQATLPATGDNETNLGSQAQKLTVNAQLQVNGQFFLAPSQLPSNAKAGMLVFDQVTSTLQYFNGQNFVPLNAQPDQAAAQAGVSSLQGQTGAVSLVPGAGIQINGTTISSSGLLGVNGVPGDINVTTANGIASLSLPQSIAPSSSPTFNNLAINGRVVLTSAGAIATNRVEQVAPGQNITIDAGADSIVFSMSGRTYQLPTTGPSAQTICTTGITCVAGGGQTVNLAPGTAQTDNTPDASIFVNDTGGGNLIQLQSSGVDRFTVAVNGDTTVGGTLNISTLRRTSGGNTTVVGFANPVANSTINLPALAAGTYEVCTSGGNCIGATAVDSLNGLTGALTLANATGVGSTITINDASTSAKGIAQFNSTNFSVSSGVVNTIQGIATSASPTFAGLTLSAPLSVASGGLGASSLTLNSVLVGNGSSAPQQVTAGSAGQCLVSTAGAPVFAACPGSGGVASIDGQTGTVTVNNATGSGGVITIDDATTTTKGIASFNGTNLTVTAGAVNTIQNIGTGASPTFAGLTLTGALGVASGGTGANNAGTARINLGAAASGANSDITSLSGLTTALSVAQGGTGAISLAANGVLLGNGSSAITSVTSGAAGLCLVSTAGAPSWQACPG
ncbi:MAG: hypothetical protein WAQ57_02330, partial [Candidatus Saccharimonadales bacterium]